MNVEKKVIVIVNTFFRGNFLFIFRKHVLKNCGEVVWESFSGFKGNFEIVAEEIGEVFHRNIWSLTSLSFKKISLVRFHLFPQVLVDVTTCPPLSRPEILSTLSSESDLLNIHKTLSKYTKIWRYFFKPWEGRSCNHVQPQSDSLWDSFAVSASASNIIKYSSQRD